MLSLPRLLLVLVSLCAACAAKSNSPAATDFSAACADSAEARCALLDSCTNNERNTGLYGTAGGAACVAATQRQCLANNQPGANLNQTPATLEACAKALAAESCTDALNNITAAACMVAGKGPANAPRATNGQCESYYCAISLGAPCGSCAAPPQPADSCANTGSCGSTGLMCVQRIGQCVTPAGTGSPCNANAPCLENLECVGSSTGKTCQAAAQALGASCDPNEISASHCDISNFGLTCSPNQQCQPAARVAAGQPCGRVNGTYEPYILCAPGDTGALCIVPVGMSVGSCAARIAAGQPCSVGAPGTVPPCTQPNRCIADSANSSTGTCQFVGTQDCH